MYVYCHNTAKMAHHRENFVNTISLKWSNIENQATDYPIYDIVVSVFMFNLIVI